MRLQTFYNNYAMCKLEPLIKGKLIRYIIQ